MNDNNFLNKFTTIISDNSIIGNYLTKNKEKFTQYNESAPLFIKVYLLILVIVNIFIIGWALYTATRCNEPICNFLVALCAPHIYAIYRMARPCLN